MYGFWRLGTRPEPSTGAVWRTNGLATKARTKAKKAAVPPSRAARPRSATGPSLAALLRSLQRFPVLLRLIRPRNIPLPLVAAGAVGLLAAALALIFFYAPLDADQGLSQKIFYLHVPIAL